MAIKDRAVTIKGSDAQIASLQIFPQPNGDVVIIVAGQTKDSEGMPRALKEAQVVYRPGANDVVSRLLGHALDALRKVNDLEDGAIALEPKVETPVPQLPARADAKG